MPSQRQISQLYKRSVGITASTNLLSSRSTTRSTFGFIVGTTFQETYCVNIVNNTQDYSLSSDALEDQYTSQISYQIQESTPLSLQLTFPQRLQIKTLSIVKFYYLDQLILVNSRCQALLNQAIATKSKQYYSIRRFVIAINTLLSRRARVISITYRKPSSSYNIPSALLTNTRSGREVGLSAQNNPWPRRPVGISACVRVSACLSSVVRALQRNNNNSTIKYN